MLLLVGLDGATFDLLTPWISEGHLPTIARLVKEGCSGLLRSTMPPITAPAWASFMTGKNLGNHGVFDFFRPHTSDLDKPEIVNMSDIQARPFWDYVSQAGKQIGILNLPVTYPPQPIAGFIVPGLLSPDEGVSIPPDLLNDYRAELGPYRLIPQRLYHPKRVKAFITELVQVTETQIQYALRLAQDHPTDCLLIHFLATDIAQHKLWHFQDATHPRFNQHEATQYGTAIRDIYTGIDTGIAQLLALLPADTTVILMSDHGFGPQHQVVNFNNFFIQNKVMALRQDMGTRLRAWAFYQSRMATGAMRLAQMMGRGQLLGFADVDWTHTFAYSRGHLGQIYLNLQGREPHGIVSPDEYQAVRQQIADLLMTLRDPANGRLLVDAVLPGEDVASGPYVTRGPDLHVVLDGGRTGAYPMFAANGRIVTRQPMADAGNHRQDGILIASGPAIQPGQISDTRLIDLAPTILHLLQIPVPDDMDGHVLTNMFTDAACQKYPILFQPAWPSGHQHVNLEAERHAEIETRLRDLGYLG